MPREAMRHAAMERRTAVREPGLAQPLLEQPALESPQVEQTYGFRIARKTQRCLNLPFHTRCRSSYISFKLYWLHQILCGIRELQIGTSTQRGYTLAMVVSQVDSAPRQMRIAR